MKLKQIKTFLNKQNYNLTRKLFSDYSNKEALNLIRKNSWKISKTNPLTTYDDSSFQEKFINTSLKINEDHIKLKSKLLESLKENYNQEEVDKLINTYCNHIGVEIDHLDCVEEKNFIYETLEKISQQNSNDKKDSEILEHLKISTTEVVNALKLLCGCEKFEEFLTKKYPTFKRYSGEGINSLIPLVQSILSGFSDISSPVKDVVMSMGHRGRVNVLAMVMDYPVRNLLWKTADNRELPSEIPGIDDILTHLANSREKQFSLTGNLSKSKKIKVTMINNPSHLEMNYPMGVGKAMAKRNDYYTKFSNNNAEELAQSNRSVGSIVIHGDAALSGQGVVYETLALMGKHTFTGTIHIVTNNQIGFTTEKSWTKPSDIFKAFDIPVLHVNSNSIVDIIKAAKICVEYNKKYNKDIVIDLIGWRKYGHNEVDEPAFTQPLMYETIRNKSSYYNTLKEELLKSNIINEEMIKKTEAKFESHLEAEFQASKNLKITVDEVTNETYTGTKTLTHKWKGINFPFKSKISKSEDTGISADKLKDYLLNSIDIKDKSFSLHARLKNYFVNPRKESIEKDSIDWPSAEIAALSSLLDEGYNVRISGQDVMRGTFSQRHIGFVDQKTNLKYFPLESYFKSKNENLSQKNTTSEVNNCGRLEVNNSILSELGVMLFEYGYSLESPNNLVIWEAQFGDFSNVAQLVYDQYLSTSEAKWMRQSGMTILLPHGFDGAGPEHSTSRVERILQLVNHQGHSNNVPDCRDVNMQVVQPTSAANYFHILRRQMKRDYRKPLIVVTPKVGLRSALYNSTIKDFEGRYKPIITNQDYNTGVNVDKSKIDKIVFTSGQSFMNLMNLENFNKNFVNIRIEELAPFPINEIKNYLNSGFKKDVKLVFVQEESLNSGVFYYCLPYLQKLAKECGFTKYSEIEYVGRPAQEGANGCVNDNKTEVKDLQKAIKHVLH